MKTRKEKVHFPQAYKNAIWAMNLWIVIQAETTGEGRTIKLFSAGSSPHHPVRYFTGLFTVRFSNRQATNCLIVRALQKD